MDLCHVTTAASWARARAAGQYAPSELGDHGFLHCCTAAQLDFVLRRHFAGISDLVLLTFDARDVPSVLRWVRTEPGQEPFPHLFGPIPLAAIRSAAPVAGPTRA